MRQLFFLSLFILTASGVVAQDSLRVNRAGQDSTYAAYLSSIIDTQLVKVDLSNIPEPLLKEAENLNINSIPARDFLRALSIQYNINLVVSENLKQPVTVRFANIPVIEVLIFVVQEYSMQLKQNGSVFRVNSYQPEPVVEKVHEPVILFQNGLLTLDLEETSLQVLVRSLSEQTGENIILRNGVRGSVSGYLQDIAFEQGLNTILQNNGYSLRETKGVFIIDRIGFRSPGAGENSGNTFWVQVEDGFITMDVVNANITDVIREIGYQTDVSMITYGLPQGQITAKTSNLTIEQALNYIFRGTSFTYRKEGDIYIIGDKATSGIASTKLVRLEHIRSDVVIDLIPESIKQNANIQVVKEQNGLMVIGTNDVILELENFIQELDYPTPQIMIEALVIDVQTSDMYQLGISLAQGSAPDSSNFNPFSAFFGQGADQSGGLRAQGTGDDINNAFSSGGNLFGIANLGKLPSNFFFRIQALDQEGLINIRSRPQISTLNGYEASIEVGTTQYFLLTTTTPLQSPNQIVTQESQRFEEIEANVLLKITPWVSASGEVTAEIHPEFNTPIGQFNSDVPPTISRRVLDSTVRLKDGETIILGGLIQEAETENINKVPILGSIPLLGRLFRNKSTSVTKSELVIFITPHVFYGDENDNDRWLRLREKMELSIDN